MNLKGKFLNKFLFLISLFYLDDYQKTLISEYFCSRFFFICYLFILLVLFITMSSLSLQNVLNIFVSNFMSPLRSFPCNSLIYKLSTHSSLNCFPHIFAKMSKLLIKFLSCFKFKWGWYRHPNYCRLWFVG